MIISHCIIYNNIRARVDGQLMVVVVGMFAGDADGGVLLLSVQDAQALQETLHAGRRCGLRVGQNYLNLHYHNYVY